MNTCEVCGNAVRQGIRGDTRQRRRHIFDSFECAIHALAPECSHCGCRIVGHGMESEGEFYLLRALREPPRRDRRCRTAPRDSSDWHVTTTA